MEKEYMEVFKVNIAYVIGIGDSGMREMVLDDGSVDKIDLHLHIELSGGHKLLLTDQQRFYIKGNDLIIEGLKEV